MRLKLLIAYDGRPFRGWQSQATGDAVQDFVEQAFMRLGGERIVVHGAGRTDAGVHATGQVAHVEVDAQTLAFEKWRPALNANLPREIRVMRITRPRSDFHARFDARGKIYTYRIWNADVLPPLELGRSWHFPSHVELRVLTDCARMVEGRHDFAGFAANLGKSARDTTRTIHEIQVRKSAALLTLRFHGEGFLYKMVRLLTGTLIRCAQGRAEPAWIAELLAEKGRLKTSFAAPADGLYLTRVLY